MDRSSSAHQGGSAESFSAAQIADIRLDLETIMNAHLEVTNDNVAELLQFFNKAVNSIIAGVTCDPKTIEQMLLKRFHMAVSVVAFCFVILVLAHCFFLS